MDARGWLKPGDQLFQPLGDFLRQIERGKEAHGDTRRFPSAA